ncbi:MAG: M23 family metallopeptidase [Clostridia bacterium]|nr:M23 family metallopeptidase [Clostridia bacterium]
MKHPKRVHSSATYAVMILCLLAAAVGAWGTAKRDAQLNRMEDVTFDTSTRALTQYTPVDVPVTGVPYTETLTEKTESLTEPVVTYQLPMGDFISKDYSGDAVVYSNTMRDWRIHTGVDFGDNRGQSVLAIADGTVTDVREDALWGVVVTIDHGNGVVAKYCGLEKDSTPEADAEVEKGVVIGKLGEIPIESKDGAHLHLEITQNGKRIDPWKLLRN